MSPARDVPPLPRQFWILFAGSLVNRLGTFVVPLFAIYLTLERGLSALAVGGVASCYGLGSLCSGALGGQLADYLGRRRTLIIGSCWGAGAMLLMPYAQQPMMIAAGAFHLGLAGDLYRPAISAAVADLCTPAQRPRAFGLLYWAVNLGFAFSTAVGGALARSGFARLFIFDAATTLAYAAVVFFFIRETRPAVLEVAADEGTMREAFADRALLYFLGVQLLVSLIFIQTQGALPVALAHRGILSDRYGLIIAENGILIVVLQPFAIRLIERMRRTRALALGALLTGLGFGMNALPFGITGAACSVAVWTLGEIIASPVIPSLISDLAPPRLRGRYQGLSQMSFGACSLIGPTLGMLVLERGSALILWRSCALVGALSAGLFLALARPLSARLAGRGQAA